MGIEPDVLYDLEINPNRPDAMSIAGVARDLAARLGLPFTLPDPSPATVAGRSRSARCPSRSSTPTAAGASRRASSATSPSAPAIPSWPRRLALLGMRSISNVVDVSNYVMLELGQPNHPYDLAKVAGPGFRVRVARDGRDAHHPRRRRAARSPPRTSSSATATTCPSAWPGSWAARTSEIDDATTDVLLEMAWFHPIGIVKSSRRHKLRSEASARFEKGTDPEVVDLAMRRFADLLGAPLEDGAAVATGTLPERPPVRVRTARVARLLGTDLGRDRIAEVLDPIGFTTTPVGDDLDVEIPSWRYDSATEIDVIEEVARHHGYTRPRPHACRAPPPPAACRRARRSAAGSARSWSAAGSPRPCRCRSSRPASWRAAGCPTTASRIANPLVAEQSVLRTSLLPGLVGAVAYNWSHRNHGVRLFEIGHTFNRPVDARRRPARRARGARRGPRRPRRHRGRRTSGGSSPRRSASRDVRRSRTPRCPGCHPTRAPASRRRRRRGRRARRDRPRRARRPRHRRAGRLPRGRPRRAARPAARRRAPTGPSACYPSSDIDLAFEVDDDVPASAVEDAIRAAGGELLWSVRLFDVYRGTGVADGRRSLAYALRSRPPIAPSPTPTSRRPARAIIDAVQSSRLPAPPSAARPQPSAMASGRPSACA